ncbi:MAG: sugar ABC transporter permease [Firmicutes bacterium]|nr:sugar ABC transporter permease [Bacillota bacterium]
MAIVFFLGPSIIGYSVFFFIPFLLGIYYSFVDNMFAANLVWLDNYIALFKSSSFRLAARNTLFFTCLCVPLNVVISLLLAMLVNQKIYCRSVFRTLLVSPLVIPVASVVVFWRIIFHESGVMNAFFSFLDIVPINWLNTDWSVVVILIIYLWKNIGYSLVLFLAGLQNIPAQYYESSYIDGANWWTRFTKITLVYLTPTTFFVFIMSIINSFKVFREVYLMEGDYPHAKIYMLQHYMNNTFASLDYQKLTSAAFIMGIVVYILVFILFVFEKKISKDLW